MKGDGLDGQTKGDGRLNSLPLLPLSESTTMGLSD